MAVVDQRYCVQQPTTLVLKEKFFSWSGDKATIKDQNGTVWFKVNPKLFSISDKREVEDAYGQAAFCMRSKLLTLHNTWEVYRGNSYEKKAKVCDVKFSALQTIAGDAAKLFGSTVKVYQNDGDSQHDYYAEGNFLSKKFTIYKSGAGGKGFPVAEIEKESQFSSVSAFIMSSQDANTYYLKLEPGADAAFLTALTIVIDEVLRDGN